METNQVINEAVDVLNSYPVHWDEEIVTTNDVKELKTLRLSLLDPINNGKFAWAEEGKSVPERNNEQDQCFMLAILQFNILSLRQANLTNRGDLVKLVNGVREAICLFRAAMPTMRPQLKLVA